MNQIDSIHQIAQLLFDKKGSNIIAIDVRGLSSITDYVVIANGNVERHVIALAKEVAILMKKGGETASCMEGMEHGDWIVLDYFHSIIHLLIPPMREKYRLEHLWSNGEVIDVSWNEKRIAE